MSLKAKVKWAKYELAVAETPSIKIHPMKKRENLIAKACGQLFLHEAHVGMDPDGDIHYIFYREITNHLSLLWQVQREVF